MYTLYTHICIHSQRYVYVYSIHIPMYITYMYSSNFGINLMNCSSLISKLKFVETTACLTLQMCLKDWLITSHTLCMRPQEPFWYWQTHKIYQTAHFTNVQKKKSVCVCDTSAPTSSSYGAHGTQHWGFPIVWMPIPSHLFDLSFCHCHPLNLLCFLHQRGPFSFAVYLG